MTIKFRCFGFSCSQRLLNYLALKYFGFERTWWRLFKKRIVHTEFNVYLFLFFIFLEMLNWCICLNSLLMFNYFLFLCICFLCQFYSIWKHFENWCFFIWVDFHIAFRYNYFTDKLQVKHESKNKLNEFSCIAIFCKDQTIIYNIQICFHFYTYLFSEYDLNFQILQLILIVGFSNEWLTFTVFMISF